MTRTRQASVLRSRPGFTLVELLVVLTIIVILASITAIVLPGILRDGKATRAASTIQGMLLTAKTRAVRDQVPAGVRFIISHDTLTAPAGFQRLVSTELVYVVQPDDLVVSGDSMTISGGNVAVSSIMDFAGGLASALPVAAEQLPVQPGDFIELSYGGLVTGISQVSSSGTHGSNYDTLTLISNPSTGFPVTDYRIIRGPRRAVSEDSVKLPTGVAILMADVNPSPSLTVQYSLNVPQRSIPFGFGAQSTLMYEIVFSPSGEVLGQGNPNKDKAVLFVRDMTRDNLTDGDPALVVVNVRTGAIGVQPVDASNPPNYYTFTTDARSSGM